MRRRRRYDLKLSLTRRKQLRDESLIGLTGHVLDWFPLLMLCLEFYQQPHYWICLQVIWRTGWEILCLRCANRMAVSIHRNLYMLWFAASKDFITKMNAMILIHYVQLMKNLECMHAYNISRYILLHCIAGLLWICLLLCCIQSCNLSFELASCFLFSSTDYKNDIRLG